MLLLLLPVALCYCELFWSLYVVYFGIHPRSLFFFLFFSPLKFCLFVISTSLERCSFFLLNCYFSFMVPGEYISFNILRWYLLLLLIWLLLFNFVVAQFLRRNEFMNMNQLIQSECDSLFHSIIHTHICILLNRIA